MNRSKAIVDRALALVPVVGPDWALAKALEEFSHVAPQAKRMAATIFETLATDPRR